MKTDNISFDEIMRQLQQMNFEKEKLQEEIEDLKANVCDARKFYCSKIGVETVAVLHNVHADTVRKYANLGFIPKHPDSTDSKMWFRASDILLLDFKRLMKESKFLPYTK